MVRRGVLVGAAVLVVLLTGCEPGVEDAGDDASASVVDRVPGTTPPEPTSAPAPTVDPASEAPTSEAAVVLTPQPAPVDPTPTPQAAEPTDPAAEPAPIAPAAEPVAPVLDPQFSSCKKAIAAGYGPYTRGVDPEYDWYKDGDGDGVNCES